MALEVLIFISREGLDKAKGNLDHFCMVSLY